MSTRAFRSLLSAAAITGALCVPTEASAEVARVSIKRVLGPDGAPNDDWTIDRIMRWMDEVNRIYEDHTSLRFDLIEIRDVDPPSGANNWNVVESNLIAAMEDQAIANPTAFSWRTDAINIYLVDAIVTAGGVCSFTDGIHQEIIFVAPLILNQSVGLAHELGHYFDLRHTHANFEGPSGNCSGQSAGDCVADTPNDINPTLCSVSGVLNQTCMTNALAGLYGLGSTNFNTVFDNVMSYHAPVSADEALLTPGQADRALDTAIEHRSHVLTEYGQGFKHYYFGDFDGDGRDDLIRYLLGVGEVVYLSNGTQFDYSGVWKTAGNGLGPKGFYVGDYDGDGRDDLLRYRLSASGSPQVEVLRSTGSSFGAVEVWASLAIGDGVAGFRVGDYDGDGKQDLMRWISGFGCDVWRSTGSSFVPAGKWSGAGQGQGIGFFPGDFNGDGRTDLARQHSSSLPDLDTDVRLSTGSSFPSFGYWTDAEFIDLKVGWYVGDFDGDGRDDIFRYVSGSSGAEMHLSSGYSFVAAGSWTTAGYGFGPDGWYIGDFNADGKDDLYRITFAKPNLFLSTGSSFVNSSVFAGSTFDPMQLEVVPTSGSKLTFTLDHLPSTTMVGLTFISATPPSLLGQGTFLGINFGAVSAAFLSTTPSGSNPFFFVPPFTPGAFPIGSFSIPLGTFPTGLTIDFMVAVLVPNENPIRASNIVRRSF